MSVAYEQSETQHDMPLQPLHQPLVNVATILEGGILAIELSPL